jgi:hypothetical protein
MRQRTINKDDPERGKQHEGTEFESLGKCSGNERRRHRGQQELKDHKGLMRDRLAVYGGRLAADAAEHGPI